RRRLGFPKIRSEDWFERKDFRRDRGGNRRGRQHRDEDFVRSRTSGVRREFGAAHRSRQRLPRASASLRSEISGIRESLAPSGESSSGTVFGGGIRIQRRQRFIRARCCLFQWSGHGLVLEAMQGHRGKGELLGALFGPVWRY